MFDSLNKKGIVYLTFNIIQDSMLDNPYEEILGGGEENDDSEGGETNELGEVVLPSPIPQVGDTYTFEDGTEGSIIDVSNIRIYEQRRDCVCGKENKGRAKKCFVCAEDRPSGVVMRPGPRTLENQITDPDEIREVLQGPDWNCVCGTMNARSDDICTNPECGMEKITYGTDGNTTLGGVFQNTEIQEWDKATKNHTEVIAQADAYEPKTPQQDMITKVLSYLGPKTRKYVGLTVGCLLIVFGGNEILKQFKLYDEPGVILDKGYKTNIGVKVYVWKTGGQFGRPSGYPNLEITNQYEKQSGTRQVQVGTTTEDVYEDRVVGTETVVVAEDCSTTGSGVEICVDVTAERDITKSVKVGTREVPVYENEPVYDMYYDFRYKGSQVVEIKTNEGGGDDLVRPIVIDINDYTAKIGDLDRGKAWADYWVEVRTDDGDQNRIFVTASQYGSLEEGEQVTARVTKKGEIREVVELE